MGVPIIHTGMIVVLRYLVVRLSAAASGKGLAEVAEAEFFGDLLLADVGVVPLYRPIIDPITLEAVRQVQIFKECPQVGVVRILLVLQIFAVAHVVGELAGVAAREYVHGGVYLDLLDFLVLFLLGFGSQALPRQLAHKEVEEDVSDAFEVVSARLLDTIVGEVGGVASCAREVFAIFVRNMLAITLLPLLGEAEVNEVEGVGVVLQPHQHILRLQISMDVAFLVQSLYTA